MDFRKNLCKTIFFALLTMLSITRIIKRVIAYNACKCRNEVTFHGSGVRGDIRQIGRNQKERNGRI